MTLRTRILDQVKRNPGVTDRWLAEALFGLGTPQQRVNGECRLLASRGEMERRTRWDGLIGNYIASGNPNSEDLPQRPGAILPQSSPENIFSEDQVKTHLKSWLEADGWATTIAWAKSPGADIIAERANEQWIIEAKGQGSLNPMRVNYFIAILGETLQRMSVPDAKYSIALPDIEQFRRLWSRLPKLAKERTQITALFVSRTGEIVEVR